MKAKRGHSVLALGQRMLLFLADITITAMMYGLSFLLFNKRPVDITVWWFHLPILIVCYSVFLLLFRCYNSLWRYADSREYMMQFLAMACGLAVHVLINCLVPRKWHYPTSVLLLVMLMSLVVMWVMRFAWRIWRYIAPRLARDTSRELPPLVIVGAGDAGVGLMNDIQRSETPEYTVYGFFDDSSAKVGRTVHGVPVLGRIDEIAEKLKNTDVHDIVVAIPTLSEEGRRRVLTLCAQTNCHVRILPSLSEMITEKKPSRTLLGQIRDVRPEDLLGREAVKFDNTEVYDFLRDKVVMVTGGGGSIGSELCRQIAAQAPRCLVIVDIYENNAYDIQQELIAAYGRDFPLNVEIASVRDRDKMDLLFRRYRPAIVFHAAAHKHVPLMENCPEEAIKNNVFGTYNTASLSAAYGAERFILISTDKAVNPTNVMGASKRICEMIVQGMQAESTTVFVAVRFGNVLGSNGSVIPLFKHQLARGGPITVTDRRIIRYFMTIPEAAQLVMQAGAMADQSQVFVLDMGEPVKILTLAENLVRLEGYEPYKDIDIIETGLRPGEKLYEELLVNNDRLDATRYDKIFVEQREPIPHEELLNDLDRLRAALATEDGEEIVRTMREIVPTFRPAEEVNDARIREMATATAD